MGKVVLMRIMASGITVALALGAAEALAQEETAGVAAQDEGPIGSVEQEYSRGPTCRITCAGLYGTACAAVSVACMSATTVTIGGTLVPCSTAIVAACGAGAAGMQWRIESCPP